MIPLIIAVKIIFTNKLNKNVHKDPKKNYINNDIYLITKNIFY